MQARIHWAYSLPSSRWIVDQVQYDERIYGGFYGIMMAEDELAKSCALALAASFCKKM